MARRLTQFLLCSAAAHALLGIWWATSSDLVWSPGETYLNVGILDDVVPNGPTKRSTAAATPLPSREAPTTSGLIATSPDAPVGEHSDTENGTAATALAQRPPDLPDSEKLSRNHLLGELKTALSEHLVYPPLARQRGWEGTVLLALRVERDGALEKVRVSHSSGYDVLDQAAVDSLYRVRRLTEVTAWLHGQPMDLQMPVIYRLTTR